VDEHGLSVRRACRAVRLSRTAHYKPPVVRTERDAPVVEALQRVVEQRIRWGFWKCFDSLRLDGHRWNHKRVHRVYCALRLNLPRRTRRRIPRGPKQPFFAPGALNETWAMDFMQDRLQDGRRFRTFNVIDESNREGLAIEISPSLPSSRVIGILDELIAQHGKPARLRCDNGPEFRSLAFTRWSEDRDIEILYIQPGKPVQNAFIERFNRSFRTEVLDAYLLEYLVDVRQVSTAWLSDYNLRRPHDSLGRVPPRTFMPRHSAVEV
jgi:putative transposase